MLSFAVLCVVAPVSISYAEPMSTVTHALSEISKLSGKTVEHTGIGHLPILIQANEIEPEALLQKIAKVTDSEMQKTETGYRLVRSPSRVAAAFNVEKAEYAERLKAAIAKKQTEWATAMDWSDKAIEAKLDRMATRLERPIRDLQQSGGNSESVLYTDINVTTHGDTPAGGLLIRLLSTLPPTTWVPDTPGGIVRLSDRPNPYQRKLPADLTQNYSQFATLQNRMRTAIEGRLQLERTNVGYGFRNVDASEISRSVILANWQYENWLALNLYIVNRDGQIIGSASTSLYMPPPPPEGELEITGETTIPVSPETQALVKALRDPIITTNTNTSSMRMSYDDMSVSLGEITRTPVLPPAVLQRMTSNLDPFEDVSGLALRAVATEEKKSLVAVLPDSLFRPSLNLAVRDKFKFSDFGTVLQRAKVKVDRDGDWLLVRPTLAAHLDRNQANRAALTALSRTLATLGYAPLDRLIAYVQSRHTFTVGSMDYIWLQALNASVVSDIQSDFAGIQLYAALPNELKNKPEANAPVTGNLIQAVAQRASGSFYGSLMMGDGGSSISRSSNPQLKHIAMFEPFEALAAGVLRINVRESEAPSLLAKRKSDGGGRFLRPMEIGAYRVMATKPQYADFISDLLPYDTFQRAKNRRVNISVMFGDKDINVVAHDELDDNAVVPPGETWTWATLPSDLKNAILEGEKVYKQRYGG